MTIGPLAAEAASLDVQPATLPSPNDTTLAAALKYIAHGWTVVPVCRAAPGGGCTAALRAGTAAMRARLDPPAKVTA